MADVIGEITPRHWKVYKTEADDGIVIEDRQDLAVVAIAMDEVIPFVKAVFSAATGREFNGEEPRWGKPDDGSVDE